MSAASDGVSGQSLTANGVRASGANGVFALGVDGHGVVAQGTIGQLHLVPLLEERIDLEPSYANAPFGTIALNKFGDIYVYTGFPIGGGPPNRWRKLLFERDGSGSTSSPTPVRLMDTRPNLPSIAEHGDQPMAAGEVFPFTAAGSGGVPGIPVGAAGVIGSIAVNNPTNAGHLQLFPGNLETASTSVLNFLANQTVANAFTAGVAPPEP